MYKQNRSGSTGLTVLLVIVGLAVLAAIVIGAAGAGAYTGVRTYQAVEEGVSKGVSEQEEKLAEIEGCKSQMDTAGSQLPGIFASFQLPDQQTEPDEGLDRIASAMATIGAKARQLQFDHCPAELTAAIDRVIERFNALGQTVSEHPHLERGSIPQAQGDFLSPGWSCPDDTEGCLWLRKTKSQMNELQSAREELQALPKADAFRKSFR